jgi:hypothetical protein
MLVELRGKNAGDAAPSLRDAFKGTKYQKGM